MKYIIFEDFAGEATPVIFPGRIAFDEIREQIPYTRVLSGGSVSLDQGAVRCREQANELGLVPREDDSRIITEHLTLRVKS